MYRVRPSRRGLGYAPTILGVPTAEWCSNYGLWPLNSVCWQYSPSAWSQMNEFNAQAATIPQPVPPGAVTDYGFPSTGAGTAEQAQAATDAALAAASDQTKANTLAAFQGMLPVLDTSGSGTGLSTTALIALGVVAGGALLLIASGSGRRRY